MPTSTQRFRLVGDDDASKAFLQVAAASRLLKSNMDDVNDSFAGLARLSGGASLIPVAAGAAGVFTELSVALGAAAGASGIFGLSAVGLVSAMAKQQKSIGTTRDSLNGLTKGTDAYKTALEHLHNKQAAFNRDFGPAAKGFDQLHDAYAKFQDQTRPITEGVLVKGMDLLSDALPKLVGPSNAAGRALGGLVDDLDGWVNGPGFAHLMDFLETSGPRDITRFGHSAGHVLSGLGGILGNFVGPGDHAARTLEHLTADFDKWGHSRGVSDSVDRFLRYVHDNGPEIDQTFSALASAAPKIATSLGKLGSLNLSVTSRFLNLVAGMPQGAFDVVVTGLFGIAAASKAITAVTGLRAILTGVAGVASGKGLAGKGLAGKAAGGVLGSVGVQKVFVVNMPPGGGLGGGGGGGVLKDAEKGIPLLGGLSAGAAAAWAAAGVGVGLAAAKGYAASHTNALLDGPFGWNTLADKIGTGALHIGPTAQQAQKSLQSTATKADALNQRLAKSSAAMDLVGHSADRAFNGTASKAVQGTTAKLQAINGVKGEQAFDLIGNSAAKNSALAGQQIDILTGKLKDIPNRNVKVGADVSQALARIASVRYQVDQLHDRTVIVRAIGGHVPGEPTGRVPGFAKGTAYFRGGLAVVGERGPELVALPRGSRVIPNDRIGSADAAGNTYNITVQAAPNERISETLPRALSRLELLYGG